MRAGSIHGIPGIGNRCIHIAGVLIIRRARAICIRQGRAGGIIGQHSIRLGVACNGRIEISFLIIIAKFHLACRGGGIIHENSDIAVIRHAIYRNRIIAVQNDEIRFAIAVCIC